MGENGTKKGNGTRLPKGGLGRGAALPQSPAASTAGGSASACGGQVLTRLHLKKQFRDFAFRGFVSAYTVPGPLPPELWRRMNETIAKYLEYLQAVRNSSPHTVLDYTTRLSKFLPHLS